MTVVRPGDYGEFSSAAQVHPGGEGGAHLTVGDLTITRALTVTGNPAFTGNLAVTGNVSAVDVTASGALASASLAVSGAASVSGLLSVLGTLDLLPAATEKTIASGTFAYDQVYHTVDTEADAAEDILDSVTGGSLGKVLFLSLADSAREVLIKHSTSANRFLLAKKCDFLLRDARALIGFIHDGTGWVEFFRNDGSTTEGGQLFSFGRLADYTIATGAITIRNAVVRIDTEGAAATDDLHTMSTDSSTPTGMLAILRNTNSARAVRVTEAGNFALVGGPMILGGPEDVLVVMFNGTSWLELFRVNAFNPITTGAGAKTLAREKFYGSTDAATVTVPSAVLNAGREYTVFRAAGGGDVTVTSAAGNIVCQTITESGGAITLGMNSDATVVLKVDGAGVRLVSNGTDWYGFPIGVGIAGS